MCCFTRNKKPQLVKVAALEFGGEVTDTLMTLRKEAKVVRGTQGFGDTGMGGVSFSL